MTSNLFIPSKIKVGFQNRSDTFTGKLAYIIYFDEKGVLRKEKSWLGWCDEKIESFEFDNTPRAGYLFNKGVQRYGYHWGSGRSVVRVYDPRDFEFEITVDNLIGILMHSDVSKRDIVEECVFAWQGTELVLLPVNSEIYQASLKYTEKQSEKISAKELVKGYTYGQKKSDTIFTYIGYYEWFGWDNNYGQVRTHQTTGKKKHVFWNGTSFVTPGIATFSSVVNAEIAENYASLVEKFFTTDNSQPIVGYQISESTDNSEFSRLVDGEIQKVGFSHYHTERNVDITRHFEDYRVHYKEYKFDNEITTVIAIDKRSRSRGFTPWYTPWYNQPPEPQPFRDKLVAKAVELGFDPTNATKEQCLELLKSEGFGKLGYVLKNGTLIKE